jgi:NADH-quinone oxidoreductase subunit J
MEVFIFYFFATILVVAAVCVVTMRNPVHSALFLVLAFFTASGIWMLLRAEFLAIALVLVYVGAVMVLFLFVVMMLDINLDRVREGFWTYLPLGATIGILIAVEMALAIAGPRSHIGSIPAPADPAANYSNTHELGLVLYTDYLYPFELAAVVLLVAMIAAIALTLRKRKDTKYQKPSDQVKASSTDRVRLVSMPVEKKEG